MPSSVVCCSVCVAGAHLTTSGSGANKQRPQCLQNRLSKIFSSAQSGHLLMAAAFVHKSYLLHDHKHHKKIQPLIKESTRQLGALVSWEGFPAISNPLANVPYVLSKGHHLSSVCQNLAQISLALHFRVYVSDFEQAKRRNTSSQCGRSLPVDL